MNNIELKTLIIFYLLKNFNFFSLIYFLQKLEWSSNEDDIAMCKYKGKSEDACQNYIKVLAKLSDDRILVCGTNAFKPKCRSYQYGPVCNLV